jgi:serine/threonine-protein phosphatase 2A catalytic subunit
MRVFSSTTPENIRNFLLNLMDQKDRKRPKKITLPWDFVDELFDLSIVSQKKFLNFLQLGSNFQNVVIVGDLHGDFPSIKAVVKPFLEEKASSIVFLGDYVDRGEFSLLVLCMVLALQIAWPERVVTLRGNHEDIEINQYYGFSDDLIKKYHNEVKLKIIKEKIENVYDHLSLAALTPQGSLLLHGGIPVHMYSIRHLNIIPKPHCLLLNQIDQILRSKLITFFLEIRWNDPSEEIKLLYSDSFRGKGVHIFGAKIAEQFIQHSHAKRIIRAHESNRDGFQALFGGKLIHIFSCAFYFESAEKAFYLHEKSDGTTELYDLTGQYIKLI